MIRGLDVEYHVQTHLRGCGAAALQMVLSYVAPELPFSQDAFVKEHLQNTPDGEDDEILTDHITAGARDLGFDSDWGRVSPDPGRMMEQISFFLEQGLPLIAAQRFKPDGVRGHFRVVIGLNKGHPAVKMHDPHPKLGGPNKVAKIDQLRTMWLPTGPSVTGGVAIWVAKKPLLKNPLERKTSRSWVEELRRLLPA